MSITFKKKSELPRCEVDLAAGNTVVATLTTAGQPYTLTDVNLETISEYLMTNTSGSVTYNDTVTRRMKFKGSASFEVSAVSRITFTLYKNASPIAYIFSIIDIESANKTKGFAEMGNVEASEGDVFTVVAVSDTNNVTVTLNMLSLVFEYL